MKNRKKIVSTEYDEMSVFEQLNAFSEDLIDDEKDNQQSLLKRLGGQLENLQPENQKPKPLPETARRKSNRNTLKPASTVFRGKERQSVNRLNDLFDVNVQNRVLNSENYDRSRLQSNTFLYGNRLSQNKNDIYNLLKRSYNYKTEAGAQMPGQQPQQS